MEAHGFGDDGVEVWKFREAGVIHGLYGLEVLVDFMLKGLQDAVV